ncbi:MAG: phosphotransferase [Gammaproteobacteria bacterium]
MPEIAYWTERMPLVPEDITAQWLSEALSTRYPGVRVESAAMETIWRGTATKLRMAVRYNDAGRAAGLPPTLVVKGGLAEHRAMMAPTGAYMIEVHFYCELNPALGMNTPACHFGAIDRERMLGVVIMEDLGPRGVRFSRPTEPLSFAAARGVLEALAGMHARWWNDPRLQEMDFLCDPLPDDAIIGQWERRQRQPQHWEEFVHRRPRGAAVPVAFHDLDRIGACLDRLRLVDREPPLTLLHGDCHVGNLFFEVDGRPGFLDWQTLRKGPWAHDVNYFMVSALDVADRRRWDRALLMCYLDALAAHGVEPPGFDAAWEAFLRQCVYGYFFWMVNPDELQPEIYNTAIATRFAMCALDHGAFDLLA